MNVPHLILDAVAVYRLTRLVTADTLTAGPRDAIVRAAYVRAGTAEAAAAEYPDPDTLAAPGGWSEHAEADDYAPPLATLVTCRWCASVWLAAGAVALRRWAPRAWQPVAEVLAFSAAAALLAGLEDG